MRPWRKCRHTHYCTGVSSLCCGGMLSTHRGYIIHWYVIMQVRDLPFGRKLDKLIQKRDVSSFCLSCKNCVHYSKCRTPTTAETFSRIDTRITRVLCIPWHPGCTVLFLQFLWFVRTINSKMNGLPFHNNISFVGCVEIAQCAVAVVTASPYVIWPCGT